MQLSANMVSAWQWNIQSSLGENGDSAYLIVIPAHSKDILSEFVTPTIPMRDSFCLLQFFLIDLFKLIEVAS